MSGETNGNGQMVQVPKAGEIVRQEFHGTQMEVRAETSATAMAAAAKAAIEAAFIMAKRFPRDLDQVRVKLLKACARPKFAEAALYHRKVGKEKNEDTGQWKDKIAEDLSIRFAEEAARNMGNLDIDSITLYDDARKKIVKFYAVDLETNTHWAKTVTIEKISERRDLKKGQSALGQRINSYGDVVFILEATPDEVTKYEGAWASKSWRDQILRHVPADIKEECRERIRKTVLDKATADPEGEKKKILDAFAGIGVEPTHLKAYLGHELETTSPAELVTLRAIFTAIRDGQTTWAAVMDDDGEGPPKGKETPPAEQPKPPQTQAGAAAPPAAETPQPRTTLTDVAAQSKAKRESKKITVVVEGGNQDQLPGWADGKPPTDPEPGSNG